MKKANVKWIKHWDWYLYPQFGEWIARVHVGGRHDWVAIPPSGKWVQGTAPTLRAAKIAARKAAGV